MDDSETDAERVTVTAFSELFFVYAGQNVCNHVSMLIFMLYIFYV